MSTTLTRHQRTHTSLQSGDTALLATSCHCFTAQVSVSLPPILESEAGDGGSCKTASAAGWCPTQPRGGFLEPSRAGGGARTWRPLDFLGRLASASHGGAAPLRELDRAQRHAVPRRTCQAVGVCSARRRCLFPSAPRPRGTNTTMGGRCVLWVQVFVYP